MIRRILNWFKNQSTTTIKRKESCEIRDINFDNFIDWFKRDIYGSSKGYIRLNVLWHELVKEVPILKQGGMKIMDAGGGMGQIALRLAHLGNHVIICDISKKMLQDADRKIEKGHLQKFASTIHSSIQDMSRNTNEKYDLIIFVHGHFPHIALFFSAEVNAYRIGQFDQTSYTPMPHLDFFSILLIVFPIY